MIEVRETLSKGRGTFTIACILRGTRVIAEAGLLKIKREHKASDIISSFMKLPTARQDAYLELHEFACGAFQKSVEDDMGQRWHDLPARQRKVLAIYGANAFNDIFLIMSRINHSCTPNVFFWYNSVTELGTYHAVHDITIG